VEASDVAFAAFYADCIHEVLPVTVGYRLALVYNLMRRGSRWVPKAPNYDKEQEAIRTLLKRWAKGPRLPADGEPEKLIYTLEHAYTPAGLGFGSEDMKDTFDVVPGCCLRALSVVAIPATARRVVVTSIFGAATLLDGCRGAGIHQGDNPRGSLSRTGRDMVELEPMTSCQR
jgi:hypothetical protein